MMQYPAVHRMTDFILSFDLILIKLFVCYAASCPVGDEVKLLSSLTLSADKSQTLSKPVSKRRCELCLMVKCAGYLVTLLLKDDYNWEKLVLSKYK